jgi:arsenate reductase (glutaredoxin)
MSLAFQGSVDFRFPITYKRITMAEIIFFSEPGCESSEQRKALLENAGNTLYCENLLSQDWTHEKLLPFVRGREPLDIINTSAPDIQMGKIDPLLLTFEQALALLVKDPLLIKGPLMQVDNLYIQGPDDRRVDKYLEDQVKDKNPATAENREDTLPPSIITWPSGYCLPATASYSFA